MGPESYCGFLTEISEVQMFTLTSPQFGAQITSDVFLVLLFQENVNDSVKMCKPFFVNNDQWIM